MRHEPADKTTTTPGKHRRNGNHREELRRGRGQQKGDVYEKDIDAKRHPEEQVVHRNHHTKDKR